MSSFCLYVCKAGSVGCPHVGSKAEKEIRVLLVSLSVGAVVSGEPVNQRPADGGVVATGAVADVQDNLFPVDIPHGCSGSLGIPAHPLAGLQDLPPHGHPIACHTLNDQEIVAFHLDHEQASGVELFPRSDGAEGFTVQDAEAGLDIAGVKG